MRPFLVNLQACLRRNLISHSGGFRAQIRCKIYRSEYAAYRPQGYPTLTHWLAEHTRPHADKTAVVNGTSGQDVAFDDLFRRAFSFAHGLREQGFRQGDVYMSFLPNTIDYVVAFLGVVASGGVFTAQHPKNIKGEVHRALDLVKPTFFHTQPQLAQELGDVRQMSPHIKELIISGGYLEGSTHFDDIITPGTNPTILTDDFDPKKNTSLILFSGGTTGLPKGVQISSNNIIACLCSQCHPRNWDMTSTDVLVNVFPMCHAAGLICSLLCFLTTGSTVVSMSKFGMEQFLHIIEKYKPTVIHMPPTLMRALLSSPLVSKYDITSVRRIFTGAGPSRENLIGRISELFNGARVENLYGMTETVCDTHSTILTNAPPGSVGQIYTGMECKIASLDDGRELDQGEKGEVLIRGDFTMLGYYDNPEATADGFDDEGYWRSGDVGYYDGDCNLFIVGRTKELIKSKGFQVAPAELEDLLLHHEAVADVAVIGVPHEEDELVRAYIVRKTGSDVVEEDLKEYVAENTAYYKHLRGGVRFIKEIPKLENGKILRTRLLDMAEAENE